MTDAGDGHKYKVGDRQEGQGSDSKAMPSLPGVAPSPNPSPGPSPMHASRHVAFPSRRALDEGRQQLAMLAQDAPHQEDGVIEDNLHAFQPAFGQSFNFSHYLDEVEFAGPGGKRPPQSNRVTPTLADIPSVDAATQQVAGTTVSRNNTPSAASTDGSGGARLLVAPSGGSSHGSPASRDRWTRYTSDHSEHIKRMELARNSVNKARQAAAAGVLGKIFGTQGKDLQLQDKIVVTQPYMLHPQGTVRHLWDGCLGAFVVITLFWTPFEIGFSYSGDFSGNATQVFWAVMDIILLLFFSTDILINFRTAIIDDGELIQEPWPVASKYLRGWFVLDLVATIPYELLLTALFPSTFNSKALAWAQLPRFVRFLRLIRFMRMIRVLKLQKLVEHLAEIGAFASLVGRLGSIAFWVLLIAHVLGCGWFFLADINSGERLTWAHEFDLHQPDTDISTKYFTSLYWAFVTVTTVGYGDIVPRTDAERVYVIICTFIGNSMFAFMIGKITSLASQMDASQALYTEKMDAVNEFMRARGLPRPLRKRIRRYYNTFWARGVYFSESDIVGELSFNIRRELAHFMNEDIIRNVPFFRDANDLFIDELLTFLKAEVCLPDDYIIREGDTGDKMYLLRKGAVAVIKDDAVSHTLTRGAFFGEITLLFPAVRRTASVKALTECEMASLTKADLMKVAENYPDFLDMMSTVAKSHLKKDEHEQQRVAMDRSAKQQPAPKATPQQLQQRAARRGSITKDGATPAWLAHLQSFAADGTPGTDPAVPGKPSSSPSPSPPPPSSSRGMAAGRDGAASVDAGSVGAGSSDGGDGASSGGGGGAGAGAAQSLAAATGFPSSTQMVVPGLGGLARSGSSSSSRGPTDAASAADVAALSDRVMSMEAMLKRQEDMLNTIMGSLASASK